MALCDSHHNFRRLKHDLLVVSCDTISNCNLFDLFDLFRNHDASVTALLVKGGSDGDVAVPGPKTKYEPGIFFRNFRIENFVCVKCQLLKFP